MNKIKYIKKTELSAEEIKELLQGKFGAGEEVVVKLHFGEPGNKTAFHPEEIELWVRALRELGHAVVLFDCPVFYKSPRDSQAGYEKAIKAAGWEGIGARTKICDEYEVVLVAGDEGEGEEKGEKRDEIKIAKILTEAKNLLVLTHVKGHLMAGFGGSIKNIGIGAVAPETKGYVHGMKSNQDEWGWHPDRIGRVVAATIKKMPRGRTLFVNIIQRVTQHCDCAVDAGEIIAPDLGILVGDNIVAIDQASLDLVNEEMGCDIFYEKNEMDPTSQIEWTAKESGLGKEYELELD